MPQPEIALLVSTYQRPAHLRRSLISIAEQKRVRGKFEVVVTDDGSADNTRDMVERLAADVDFPLAFSTHPHVTFQLSRCRNEGVAASQAPYLLFLDGDCILPHDYVWTHLERRRPNFVLAGNCSRLDREASERVSDDAIRSEAFRAWESAEELRRLKKLDRRARFYRLIRHPTKPKLIGNSVGIWRSDYERVNGYDENFEGWGCEDDDLRYRLRRAGVQVESCLRWGHTVHLWHRTDVSAPRTWKEGVNVPYLLRPGRLTRCRNGLVKRPLGDLAIRVIGADAQPEAPAQGLLRAQLPRVTTDDKPELEILVFPGGKRFSGQADCNLLLAVENSPSAVRAARYAHMVVGPGDYPPVQGRLQFDLDELDRALAAVA